MANVVPLAMHWACCCDTQLAVCCERWPSDETLAEFDVWLPEPLEQGFPSLTSTGTATLRGELEDCKEK